jgi:hypothetical protein
MPLQILLFLFGIDRSMIAWELRKIKLNSKPRSLI